METTLTNSLLTVDELCDYLRIGKTSAYRLLKTGQIESFRINRKWMVSETAINDYINENKIHKSV